MRYSLHAADLAEDKPGTPMGSTGGSVSAMNQTQILSILHSVEWWLVPNRTARMDS